MIRNEQRLECLSCGHQSSLTRTTCKKCKALLRDEQGELTTQAQIVETGTKQIAVLANLERRSPLLATYLMVMILFVGALVACGLVGFFV